MPYRVDLLDPPADALDRLVALGALDVELSASGFAALIPDSVAPEGLARALGGCAVAVSPMRSYDDGAIWVLTRRPVRFGRFSIVTADTAPGPDLLRLGDGPAFGTGLHPTTALCLEALERVVEVAAPERVLDVGTGSGVLSLAALRLGVPHATAIDIDPASLRDAGENARLNALASRLRLVRGGPGSVEGTWPLVLANVQAAPLIEMAPLLVRRVGGGGLVVLSGIAAAVAPDVERAYRRFGMHVVRSDARSGWTALTLRASW